MITRGLDVGSLWTKAVVQEGGEILGWSIAPTGVDAGQTARAALSAALTMAGGKDDKDLPLAITGAGKKELDLPAEPLTEVLCAAKGAFLLHPGLGRVIDLGGENTRVVCLDKGGNVTDFALNDKCAAGTGLFLDALAKVMGVPLERMGPLSLESKVDIPITSMCVAFAESEVVSLVHRQTPKEDILRGIHRSIASRVAGLVRRAEQAQGTMLIGGLARNQGIVAALEELLKETLIVPSSPQIVSALGAAALVERVRGQG